MVDSEMLKQAIDMLKEDVEELNNLISEAKKSKEGKAYLDIAIRCKDLADLFYEGLEDFSVKFDEYKSLSAEYYLKVAKSLNFVQANLMAVLLYLQANNLKKAEWVMKKVEKGKKRQIIDDNILEITIQLMKGNISAVEKQMSSRAIPIDENIVKDLELTILYLKKRK
jgi:hypothetical protein